MAGTESPTRFTKIVRNPGQGTKYVYQYQETDYVSRYTKTAAPGSSYLPPAPPPPPDPEPEPEPEFIEPSVLTKTVWGDKNDYLVGLEVEAFSATFQDGNPETQIIRSKWQTRLNEDHHWLNGPWTIHPNEQIRFSKPLTEAGEIRLHTQVRDESWDPVVQVVSATPVRTVVVPPMVAEPPTLSGEPYVGETITCAQPDVSGGIPPYSYNYTWLDTNAKSSLNTTKLVEYDLGKMVSCYVTVTDSVGTQVNTTSNQIGPIGQYTIGDILLTNSTTEDLIENDDVESIIQGASVTYIADYTGTCLLYTSDAADE